MKIFGYSVSNTFVLALTAFAFQAQVATADILTLNPGPNSNNGVNISTGATATVNNTTLNLTTVASGLRKKSFFSVYVAQLMVSDNTKFDKSSAANALASMSQEQAVAMRLTFLIPVDNGTVASSFQDSFEANKGPSTVASDVSSFMDNAQMIGDVASGGSMTIMIAKNVDGTYGVTLENVRGAPGTADQTTKSFNASASAMNEIMSIWLGNTADSGLSDLQTQLLQN